jgi:hypothetical protein
VDVTGIEPVTPCLQRLVERRINNLAGMVESSLEAATGVKAKRIVRWHITLAHSGEFAGGHKTGHNLTKGDDASHHPQNRVPWENRAPVQPPSHPLALAT